LGGGKNSTCPVKIVCGEGEAPINKILNGHRGRGGGESVLATGALLDGRKVYQKDKRGYSAVICQSKKAWEKIEKTRKRQKKNEENGTKYCTGKRGEKGGIKILLG